MDKTDFRTAMMEGLATLGASATIPANATIGRNGLSLPYTKTASPADLNLAELPFDETLAHEQLLPQGFDKASLAAISLSFARPELAWPEGAAPRTDADFVVTGVLGEGGMGVVYLARQRTLNRDVAIKLPRTEGEVEYLAASLISEAMLVGSLEHPSIIPVHALARDLSGRPVLVMKRVEGVAWSDLLENACHPAWWRVDVSGDDRLSAHLQILMHVANALAYAHDRGVVHRDVKPQNVMVGQFGEVYLVDWGVACRMGEGGPRGLVGTPVYMAPEMLSGLPKDVDERTDVYLLGATLHEVITGRYRHDGDSLPSAFAAALESKPARYEDHVPGELAALCNEATSHDKEKRPPNAVAFRQRVARYLEHRSSIAMAASAEALLRQVEARFASDAAPAAMEIGERLAECRFGFLEALRAWGGNGPARSGLDRCLARMIDREIDQRNPASARILLGQRSSPSPEIAARIEGLEEDLRLAREREEDAIRRAREMDPGLWAGPRAVVLGVMLLGMSVGDVMAIAALRSGAPLPMGMSLLATGATATAVVVGAATAGRRLLANEYNRRVIGFLIALCAATTVSDAVAWGLGVDSRRADVFDAIWLAGTFAIGAQTLVHAWWRIVPVWLAAAGLGLFVPSLANISMAMAQTLSLVMAFNVLWRSAHQRHGSPRAQ